MPVHPRPFESVLWRHIDGIENLLNHHATWAEVVQWLKDEHGVTITMGSCCSFWQRYQNRKTFPYKVRGLLRKNPVKSKIQVKATRAPLDPLVGAE